MKHRLAPPPTEYDEDATNLAPEYELTDDQAEALLDDGVIYHCEMHDDRVESVYHVDPEFACVFDDPAEMWRDIEARLARLDEMTLVPIRARISRSNPLTERASISSFSVKTEKEVLGATGFASASRKRL